MRLVQDDNKCEHHEEPMRPNTINGEILMLADSACGKAYSGNPKQEASGSAALTLASGPLFCSWVILALVLALGVVGSARGQVRPNAVLSPSAPDAALERELRAKDQALLDQTAPRDRAMWEATLAPEAMTLDENGRMLTRADMISGLADRPPSISVQTEMTDYRLRRWGDMATVIHTDAESESFHGQILHSIYLTTETWKLMPDGWRVVLIHIFAAPKDPPSVSLPARELSQYVGRYRAATDLIYNITLENGALLGARDGKPGVPLLAETPDVFFIKGQPRTRKIFQRDAKGHVTGFVDRREGTDIVWNRIGYPAKR
ncbi:MAG: DUF4440 domain-containing protein [Sphingomonas sp.]